MLDDDDGGKKPVIKTHNPNTEKARNLKISDLGSLAASEEEPRLSRKVRPGMYTRGGGGGEPNIICLQSKCLNYSRIKNKSRCLAKLSDPDRLHATIK